MTARILSSNDAQVLDLRVRVCAFCDWLDHDRCAYGPAVAVVPG